jgi:hypothetical protein
MDQSANAELERLRADYAAIVQNPFSFFYCPVLFRDENVELCKGHLVNREFGSAWTIQRRDIDSFFGRHFESDFVDIQYCSQAVADKVMFDSSLSSKLKPTIRLNDQKVDYYLPTGPVPKAHSLMLLTGSQKAMHIALKLPPDVVTSTANGWQIVVEKDLRVAALVSLIKAGHLTMFKMFGYRYCLSAGGEFVGKTLGSFFLKASLFSKAEAVAAAYLDFAECVNLVRPMLDAPATARGTIDDGHFYVCISQDEPWAFIVFLRIAQTMHAVLMPVLERGAEAAARFHRFCQRAGRIEVRRAQYAGNQLTVAEQSEIIDWPEANFD